MPFKPGQSGNPGGRAKVVAEEIAKFRHGDDLQRLRERLLGLALNDPDGRVAIAAIKEWNDRAYGKAPQAITGDDGGAIKVDNTAGIMAVLERLAKRET